MYVLDLTELAQADLQQVGGKAANLGVLSQAGFPVPAAAVVLTRAYEEILKSLKVEAVLGGLEQLDPAEQEAVGGEIRQQLETAELPAAMADEILGAADRLQAGHEEPLLYAVRSSATAEDTAAASFAGQHDTYYYVTRVTMLTMVRKCWASLWNASAISYRGSHGIRHAEVRMAVIVQEMIRSDVAGITFTANPVSGDRSEVITDSSWGMGAAIVDGRVTPDHFRVARDGLAVLEQRIADKKFYVPTSIRSPKQSRLREVALKKRQRPSLTPEQLSEVTDWALKADAHFGAPQDVEWSLCKGRYYLLQSRPVTRLGRAATAVPEGQFVLFKPVAENFTGPLYPLTIDLVLRPLPFMAAIEGRAYLDLRYVKPLLPLRLSDADLAALAYLGKGRQEALRIDWRKLPVLLLILGINYLVTQVLYRRLADMPDGFMESFRAKMESLVADDALPANLLMVRVLAGVRFFEPLGNMALLVNILAASRYPIYMGLMGKLLRRWLPDARLDAESVLCSGSEGVLSAEMGRRVWHLAKLVLQSPDLASRFRSQTPEHLLEHIRELPEAAAFLAEFDDFLRVHGHRALREFEIQSPRWEENPVLVLSMIRNYLLADSDPETLEESVRQSRVRLETEIRQALEALPLEPWFGLRWRIIDYLRGRTRYFAKQRENSRFYHMMGFYALRRKVLRLEDRLLLEGQLKCRDDIFYLQWPELERLLSGESHWDDVENIIRERRMEHIRLSKLNPARTIGIAAPAAPVEDPLTTRTLIGQGASPGVYVGVARVVLDPAVDATVLPGEILVAPYTDPAWTPLFLIAQAAVIEVGSYLSHAGTVAREYGMPCVVDVPGCTSLIKSGDRIRVNGTLGRVEFTRVEAGG